MNDKLFQITWLTAVAALFCALVAAPVDARIYKTVDENGNIIFTDIPPREDEPAEQIIVEQPNAFSIEEAIGPQLERRVSIQSRVTRAHHVSRCLRT